MVSIGKPTGASIRSKTSTSSSTPPRPSQVVPQVGTPLHPDDENPNAAKAYGDALNPNPPATTASQNQFARPSVTGEQLIFQALQELHEIYTHEAQAVSIKCTEFERIANFISKAYDLVRLGPNIIECLTQLEKTFNEAVTSTKP